MISKAVVRYLRISPRKARAVISLIKGRYVNEAFDILRNTNKKSAFLLIKLINSAVANAKRIPNVREDDIFISDIYADGGPSLKRYKAQALGRATMIKRRTSHITVELDMKEPSPTLDTKRVAKVKKAKTVTQQTVAAKTEKKKTKTAKSTKATVRQGAKSGP